MKKLINLLTTFLNRWPLDSRTAGGRTMQQQPSKVCRCYREHEIELIYDPIDDQILRLEPDNLLTMRIGLDENNERIVITRDYYNELKHNNDLIGKHLVESLIGQYQTR